MNKLGEECRTENQEYMDKVRVDMTLAREREDAEDRGG